MKLTSRVMVGACCFVLLLLSWVVAVNSKSTAEKQLELMRQATELVNDGIYITAVPLLEEAAGYNAAHTLAAEEELKRVYLALIDNRGFSRRYLSLLDKQMNRRDALPSVFAEAAGYYIRISRIPEALTVLKTGIERTASEELTVMYEANRYAYDLNRTSFEHVEEIHGRTVQVLIDGLWGIATSDGILLIPCEYDKISTYSGDRAIVMRNGEVYAVDRNNNRVALLRERASDFGNFADNRVSLLIDGVWRRSMGDLVPGAMQFEQIGMYSGGHAAARTGGSWGVIDSSSQWLIPAQYDGIVQDGLGRCYARGAVFVQSGDEVLLLVGGRQVGNAYEDARPFSNEGYAAVKRGGLWGFIDLDGTVMVDFMFDDALSFGQHLAAVKIGEHWGYISLNGHVVIEPVFLEARSFSGGSAPVLTERGWQFIILLEYKKGVSL